MTFRKKMITLIAGIVLIVAALAGALWYFFFMKGSCNPVLPKESVVMGNTTYSVEMARTMMQTACGLSGRSGLGKNEGMLFFFKTPGVQSFWMKDMQFPLDIIWIGGDKVLGFAENVDPQIGAPVWSLKIYDSPDGTDKVLEVNAGTVAANGIKGGDTVHIGG